MFPFVFEWDWDMSHIIFMGCLWLVLIIMGIGLTYCIIRAVIDTYKKGKISYLQVRDADNPEIRN